MVDDANIREDSETQKWPSVPVIEDTDAQQQAFARIMDSWHAEELRGSHSDESHDDGGS